MKTGEGFETGFSLFVTLTGLYAMSLNFNNHTGRQQEWTRSAKNILRLIRWCPVRTSFLYLLRPLRPLHLAVYCNTTSAKTDPTSDPLALGPDARISSVRYGVGRGGFSLCDPPLLRPGVNSLLFLPASYDTGPWPGCGAGWVFYFPR